MNPSDLKPNMRLEAGLLINQRMEYVPVRIEEISAEYMALSMPMWRGTLIPLRCGRRLSLRIFKRDSYYGFDTTVVERKLQPVPLLIVQCPQIILSLGQMREHVRISVVLPVRFRQLSGNNNDFSAYDAFTSNISAGGALLCTDIPLQKGQQLWVELHIPETEVICCQALIVRVFTEAGSIPRGRVGLKYIDIEEKDRDRMARYIFSKQREFIQKGLLED
ncbi:MAG: flagellar brake protein [Syntrophomonadaceae bacterium]